MRPTDPHLEAGRAALAASDWSAARTAFEATLAIEESAEALEGLGWALWWLDLAVPSLEARERAYRAYAQAGEARAAGRLAYGIAIGIFDYQGGAVMNGWLQRSRRHLADLPPCAEQGWLALWEGHYARMVDSDFATANERATEAVDRGRKHAVGDLELLGLALQGATLVSQGQVEAGMQRLDEATAAAIAGEINDLDAAATACCFLMHACEQVRDLARAAQWVERVAQFSERWRIRPLFAICRVHQAALKVASGDWAGAELQLDEVTSATELPVGPARNEAMLHMGELRRRQGRWDEASRWFGEVESYSLALVGRAVMALDEGDPRTAAHLLARSLRRAAPDNWTVRAIALLHLAHAHGELAEPAEVSRQLASLRELADTVGTDFVRGTLCQAEATAAADAGDAEAARQGLEDAIDLYERCQAPYEAARARLGLAMLLDASGQEASARRERERAHTSLVRLGAARDVGAAEASLASGVSASEPHHSAAEPRLTPREREVLALVAEGLADKEVAARLGLSDHTVHRHVSNVLLKLDVPSRSAAVAMALRRKLI